MKIKLVIFTALFMLFSSESKALNIFACEPEWASLVKEIAKDEAEVFSATTAFQDAHYIQARPSLIANMRKADLVICSGAGLEDGWLPILLQKAGKSSVQMSGNASIMAAKYIKTLEKPARVDRSEGDVHPEGNPHLHLNPHNIAIISDIVLEKLILVDGKNKAFYEKNHSEFKKKWSSAIADWEKESKQLSGMKVITRHKNFSYLLDWLKIENVGTLEPKPGVPPTSKHLSELVDIAQNQNVSLIIYAPFEDSKSSKWLSEKAEIPAVLLPYTIDGDSNSKNLFALFSETIKLIKQNIKD